MSLPNTDPRYLPKETSRIAKTAFPKGNLAMHFLALMFSFDFATNIKLWESRSSQPIPMGSWLTLKSKTKRRVYARRVTQV